MRAAFLALLFALPAAAQDTRPRVVFVFDTSGSMGVDLRTGNPTGGDGSREYPGDGNTSRLFVAKNAVSALVETTSEVEFALMRYPQLEGPGINRGALDGRQLNTYAGLADQPLNYAGECTGRLRDADADHAASLIVPFAQDNEGAVLQWMDHAENYPRNKELRADGPTPVVETLRLAAEYLGNIIAADPRADCRPYAVVLLTDGGESCVAPGEREDALMAQAAALQALGVRTYVVAFSVGQADVGLLGVLARAGGTAVDERGRPDLVRGLPYQADDLQGLRLAFNRILQDALPVEACNGVDDDCDGRADEGVLNACGGCGPAPEEACDGADQDCDGRVDEGALNACGRCGPVPAEICNGADDDCDGAVDEEVANACGGCAGVQPEVCNNLDDDCDGRVDNVPGEDAPLTRPCGRELGACRPGVERCLAGVWQACDGVAPADEACNGVDDDCDGATDEVEQPCGPAREIGDVGECRVGRRRCDPAACADPEACALDGWLAACEEAVGPAEEICDGRDNDCDGSADEGLFNACGRCGPTPPESCNGVDDNCDGRIDEDARCPGGYLCFAGECVQRCDQSGECSGDFACRTVYPGADYCHPNPCAGIDCGPGQRCDAEARRCVDPCADVACADGEGCDLGVCVPATCRHTGCPAGQRCVGDACEADPCADVACGDDAFCRDGACVDACRRLACGEDLRCVDGACVADACGGRCLQGERCDPADGLCARDPCFGQPCPVGMACEEGACRADAACVGIQCPAGTRCRAGTCTDETPGVLPGLQRPAAPDAGVVPDAAAAPDATPMVDAAPAPDAGAPPATGGGDDGGCQASPGGGGAGLALLLLALVGRRRRGLLLALGLLGCDDGGGLKLEQRLDAAPLPDLAVYDASAVDARVGCSPSPEICNAIDDDCDGLVDADDPDLQRILLDDPENCGACDRVCQAPRATLACLAGDCVIIGCAQGFGDYNGELADGCESDCVITAGGNEICDEQDNDCDGVVDEGFDLATDPDHCGRCADACPRPANADTACVDGDCVITCRPGYTDLDPAVDGCEYACQDRGNAQIPEYCNGLDDDCDGRVDEAPDLRPPDDTCGELGLCARGCDDDGGCGDDEACRDGICGPADVPALACAADADCQAQHPGLACLAGACAPRLHGPQCDGASGWRCARPAGWRFGDEAGACDGQDNDCDGRVDEDFVGELFAADRETPRACFVGLGVCQREGVALCAADGDGVTCSVEPGLPNGPDDDCDGDDDDCDGRVDEAFADAWIAVRGVQIHAYEASRPGATARLPGRDVREDDGVITWITGRACSRPGVLPWADVSAAEAEEACALAGARLCTGEEWALACGGPAADPFPYGAAFDEDACNGGGHDAEPGRPGDQDAVLACGSLATCARAGVFDLSGNLKEWTSDTRDRLRVVRGGSYETNVAAGLACAQENDLKDPTLRHPGIGFRCCR